MDSRADNRVERGPTRTSVSDPLPCTEFPCLFLELATVAECERSRCSLAYIRRREEDAIEREKKDAKVKENFNARP